MRRLRFIFLLLFGISGVASARETTVVGGSSSAQYYFTGSEANSFLHEGKSHDVRFEAAGMFGYELFTGRQTLTAAVSAGAQLAASWSEYRSPYSQFRLDWQRRYPDDTHFELELNGDLTSEVMGRFNPAGTSSTTRVPAVALEPRAQLSLGLGRHDALIADLSGELLWFLMDHNLLEDDNVGVAYAVQLALGWTRSVGYHHELRVRGLTRLMGARAPAIADAGRGIPPGPMTTVLVGAQVGYGMHYRQYRLSVDVGLGRPLGYENSHLFAVEPLLGIRLVREGRRDRFLAGISATVAQNEEIGGLPQRVIEAQIGWRRTFYRRWRGEADMTYIYNNYGRFAENFSCRGRKSGEACRPGDKRDADISHLVSLRARLSFTLFRSWRLFTELSGAIGALSGATFDRPTICGGATPCASVGYQASGLLGLAYIHAEDGRDERLLDAVWRNR